MLLSANNSNNSSY